MPNIQQRVAECFENVFPGVSAAEIPNANTASLKAWDSVAHITLLSAISEEFNIELEVEDYEELTSFRSIVSYLAKVQPG